MLPSHVRDKWAKSAFDFDRCKDRLNARVEGLSSSVVVFLGPYRSGTEIR